MEIMVDTGVGDWNFDEAESLVTVVAEMDESVRSSPVWRMSRIEIDVFLQSSGYDRKLFKYKSQLMAQGHLHIAQAICHARLSNMDSRFGVHAQRALSILSELLPWFSSRGSKEHPASSSTGKAKRKGPCHESYQYAILLTSFPFTVQSSSEMSPTVLDNPMKLDLQLGWSRHLFQWNMPVDNAHCSLENLYNNLGMFSHGIQRIEVLRLRRGIQRQAPELKGGK